MALASRVLFSSISMRHLPRKLIGTVIKRGYADGQMPLTFASPSQVFYNNSNVRQIDVPSYSGSFGILPNHVPCLAVIKPGVVAVTEEDGKLNKIFVSSGTITINEDSSVQVLAEEAVPVQHLDPQLCRDGLSQSHQAVTSAASEEAKAQALIAVEVFEALNKAIE